MAGQKAFQNSSLTRKPDECREVNTLQWSHIRQSTKMKLHSCTNDYQTHLLLCFFKQKTFTFMYIHISWLLKHLSLTHTVFCLVYWRGTHSRSSCRIISWAELCSSHLPANWPWASLMCWLLAYREIYTTQMSAITLAINKQVPWCGCHMYVSKPLEVEERRVQSHSEL